MGLTGVLRDIVTVIGGIFGLICGILIGHHRIYYYMNQSNTLGDEEGRPNKERKPQPVAIVVGLFFVIVGALVGIFASDLGTNASNGTSAGTLYIFAGFAIFIGAAAFIGGIKGN